MNNIILEIIDEIYIHVKNKLKNSPEYNFLDIRDVDLVINPKYYLDKLKQNSVKCNEEQLLFLINNIFKGRDYSLDFMPKYFLYILELLNDNNTANIIVNPIANNGILSEHFKALTNAKESICFIKKIKKEWIEKYSYPEFISPNTTFYYYDQTNKSPYDNINSNIDVLIGSYVSGNIFKDEIDYKELEYGFKKLSKNGKCYFIITEKTLMNSKSIFRDLKKYSLNVDAIFSIPRNYWNYKSSFQIKSYLIVLRRTFENTTFFAQFSNDQKINEEIVDNYQKKLEGKTNEMGYYGDFSNFYGFEYHSCLRNLSIKSKEYNREPIKLIELAKNMNFHRDQNTDFKHIDNSIYIPIIGKRNVVLSPKEFELKNQNYIQVVLDIRKIESKYLSSFFNSSLGLEIRTSFMTGYIKKLNKKIVGELPVFIPRKSEQDAIRLLVKQIEDEHNKIESINKKYKSFKEDILNNPMKFNVIKETFNNYSNILSETMGKARELSLSEWIQLLPTPLACIIREAEIIPNDEDRIFEKEKRYIAFFEAYTMFIATIYISAYKSDARLWEYHYDKFFKKPGKYFRFDRPDFGAKLKIVNYFSQATRENIESDQSLIKDIFCDPTGRLARVLSSKKMYRLLSSVAEKARNPEGHFKTVSITEKEDSLTYMNTKLQNLIDLTGDLWRNCVLTLAKRTEHYELEKIYRLDFEKRQGTDRMHSTFPLHLTRDIDLGKPSIYCEGSNNVLLLEPLIILEPKRLDISLRRNSNQIIYFYNGMEDIKGGEKSVQFINYYHKEKKTISYQLDRTIELINHLSP